MNLIKRYRIVKILQVVSLIFTLSFVVVFMLFRGIVTRQLETLSQKNIEQSSAIMAEQVNTYLTKYASIVEQTSFDPILLDFVEATRRQHSFSNSMRDETLHTLQQVKALDTDIALVWIGVNDVNDVFADATIWHTSAGFVLVQRPWYKEMLQTGGLTYTTPYHDAGTGNLIVSVVTPLYSSGNVIAEIGLDIDISRIEQMVASFQTGSKGYATLISNYGKYVVNPKVQYALGQEDVPLTNQQKVLMGKIRSADSGSFRYTLDGEDLLIAYTRVTSSGWVVGSCIPWDETRTLVNLFNVLSMAVMLIGAVLILIFELIIRLNSDYKALKQREDLLTRANEELAATYEQLNTSDEELQAQLEETYDYNQKLEALQSKFNMAVELADTSVWELHPDSGIISFSNARFLDKHHVGKLETAFADLFQYVFREEDRGHAMQEIGRYLFGFQADIQLQLQTREGNWVLLRGRQSENIVRGVILDITEMKHQEQQMEGLAYIDPLTEMPNRRKFFEELERSLALGERGAVMLLDLDNFKEINDTMGHIYGDEVLKIVGERLTNFKTDKMFVSRFGGDEFLVLIRGVEQKSDVSQVIGQLFSCFSEKTYVGSEEFYINMSVGVSVYPADSTNVSHLIMNADLAMYTAKREGQNKHCFFVENMKEKIEKKSKVERILREAIEREAFQVVYQPQIRLADEQVDGYEALIRLKNATITPDIFIPLAESNGMIVEIGRWITREVVRQISRWQQAGYDVKPVAINFSVKQLNDILYLTYLEDLLKQYNVRPELLEFEVTESILLEEETEAINMLERLSQLGISIALDDFGKGYSSIHYLTYLPIRKIKLDKSLIDKFLTEKIGVISNIVGLAHNFRLQVVAEGVETSEQYEKLKTADCDLIQGYYFCKPITSEELEESAFLKHTT